MRLISIDPGAGGAVTLLLRDRLVRVHDMPVSEIRGKRRVNASVLADLIRDACPEHAFVELTGARPGQGVSSMYAFGRAAGIVEGVLAALRVSTTFVPPAVWKGALRVPADKGGARARASQLFPGHASLWARVKDDGRAEAALIGLWGWRAVLAPGSIEW